MLVPLIIVNLSTDYTYQYNVDYQYVFGSGAMLFCAFVKEVSTLKQKRKVLLISAMSAVILFSVTQLVIKYSYTPNDMKTPHL